MVMKRMFRILAFLVFASIGWAGKPLNVVLIVADDLGVMDVSPYNPDTFYDTPSLERLARSGVRFTEGYAASPVCSPSRSAIMTGQWPSRTRNTHYFGGPNEFFGEILPADYDPLRDGRFKHENKRPVLGAPYLGQLAKNHITLAEAMKANGYATFFAGKWHLGPVGSLPTDHGFDHNLGGSEKGGPYGGNRYFSPYGNPYLPDGPPGEHLTDRLATETAKFIQSHKDGPFFAMLSFYDVHTPLMGRSDLVEKYEKRRKERGLDDRFEDEAPRKNRIVQSHAVYGAMVEGMDQAVGKVLDALEEAKVADRTLVIFTSDNGGLSTSEGSPTSNLPFRAGKGWLYEGGIRVPVIVRWPAGGAAGKLSSWKVTGTDFFPTVLEAAGLAPLPAQHKDGVSFVQALKNPQSLNKDRLLYWHYPHWGNQGGMPGSAVRQGDWMLIDWKWARGVELYHLGEDPGERRNVADQHPEIVAAMRKSMEDIHADTGALMPAKNPGAPAKPFVKW